MGGYPERLVQAQCLFALSLDYLVLLPLPRSSLLLALLHACALVPEQVLASRGLGTIFRKFPAANANEGHSLLLESHLQVRICPPWQPALSRRLIPAF